MTRQLAFILAATLVFICDRTGRCDTPIKDIPPGPDKIVSLKEGDKAPYAGQLYDPATALRWANWLLQFKTQLEANAELQKKICEAEVKLAVRQTEIQVEKDNAIISDLKSQVVARDVKVMQLQHELDSPPFYKTPLFGIIVGVIGAGALVAGGIALTH